MKKSVLAINGGDKMVTRPPEEPWVKINDDVKAAVMALMDEQVATIGNGGGVVGEFETAFTKMIGTKYALTMSNGTATLHSAYFAIGIGPGDEVIVPTYTWHASITPILHCAATPVFCDIDPDTLTIDPDDIERKITPRTKALCIVHVFGNVCDMDRIMDIVKRHKLALIEDCSHAHGAKWKGQPVGSFGDIGCFSMQGSKAVSGGECGVATTNDPELVDQMILLGHFGRKGVGKKNALAEIGDMSLGTKYRPHAWAVAMGKVELTRLPELNAKRTANYEFLNNELRNCPGIEVIDALPGAERAGYLEFKYKFTKEILQSIDRQTIINAIEAEGLYIAADRYSELNYTYGLLHTAPLFTTFDLHSIGGCFYDPSLTPEEELKARKTPSLPVAEDLAQRLFTLPAYIDLEHEELKKVAAAIIKVMEHIDELSK